MVLFCLLMLLRQRTKRHHTRTNTLSTPRPTLDPHEAWAIHSNLVKNGHRNAAQMLHDRIKACEAADLLATKDLSSLEKPAFKLLLSSTAEFVAHYSLQIKLKIVNYRATDTLLAVQEAFTSDKEDIKQDLPMRFEDLVSILALQPCDPTENTSFDGWKGKHQDVFNSFCHEVYEVLVSNGLLPDEDALGGETVTSFDAAVNESSGSKELHKFDFKELVKFAED